MTTAALMAAMGRDRGRAMATKQIRVGMLTPSSNTVLEPVTSAMAAELDGVSVHFSRFTVKEIALDATALGQFDLAPMLQASRHLADAKVDVISWNGTSSSWLGLDSDRRLVSAIQSETETKASTCVLSLMDCFQRNGITRYGLVSPYTDDVQSRIVDNFSSLGLTCAGEVHFGIRDNFAFGLVPEATIAEGIRTVAAAKPQAIAILCTNLAGARLAGDLEGETGVSILDSVSLTFWGALRTVAPEAARLPRWGRLLTP